MRPLSPSAINKFKTCPLSYRYSYIDELPQKPSREAFRGNVVHRVLEVVFDEQTHSRTLEKLVSLIPDAIDHQLSERPDAAWIFGNLDAWDPTLEIPPVSEEQRAQFHLECVDLLEKYLKIEDPTRLEPAHREVHLQVVTQAGVALHGIVDRVDVSPDGRVRIADYKTGKQPANSAWLDTPLFQLKFYATLYWYTYNVLPERVRLVYLGSESCVDEQVLQLDVEEVVTSTTRIAKSIQISTERQDFPAKINSLCRFCSFQKVCPEQGGEQLPFPSIAR